MTTTMSEEKDAAMPPQNDKEAIPTVSDTTEDATMKEVEEKEPNNEEKTKEAKKDADTTPVKLPPRPIKKARTAYFIFADEKRAEIAARHPGEGVGAVARETGQLWSALTEEEKVPYHEQSAHEKEQVKKALELYKDLPDSAVAGVTNDKKLPVNALSLPSARIRKIAKLDPDVKGMGKEALLLITKSAELFTSKLGMETVKVAALQNRRKLLPEDVAHVCSAREQFLFLRDDIKDLQQEQHAQNVANKQKKASTTSETATTAAAANAKPLTDYFGSVNKTATTASSTTSVAAAAAAK